MTAGLAPLDFWFDYHSPWSYLAATRIEALAARHGRGVAWRPLHLARLIEAIGGRQPLLGPPAFVRWYQQDLQDWAALLGVPLRYHPDFPLRPARALRATLLAAEEGLGAAFAQAVFRAYWTESRDISALEVLEVCGESVGLIGLAVVAAACDPDRAAALAASTAAARALGVFGAPTVVCDGKLYFGNDRLDLLDRHLAGAGVQ